MTLIGNNLKYMMDLITTPSNVGWDETPKVLPVETKEEG
jgi:hypothetical protein